MLEKTCLVLGQTVRAQASRVGEDLHLLVYGGDAPHIGGLALAIPYLSAGSRPSAYLSSLSVPGHKDEILWRTIAKRIAVKFDTKVLVAGGVHFDGLAYDKVEHVSKAVEQVAMEAAQSEYYGQGV